MASLADLEARVADDHTEAVAFRRSVEDGQAELKDLILQALDRGGDQ